MTQVIRGSWPTEDVCLEILDRWQAEGRTHRQRLDALIRSVLTQHILREPSGCQGRALRYNNEQNRELLQSERAFQAEKTAHAKARPWSKCAWCSDQGWQGG